MLYCHFLYPGCIEAPHCRAVIRSAVLENIQQNVIRRFPAIFWSFVNVSHVTMTAKCVTSPVCAAVRIKGFRSTLSSRIHCRGIDTSDSDYRRDSLHRPWNTVNRFARVACAFLKNSERLIS